jgi:hypothetical protein
VYKVNLLLYARADSNWKFQPVRKTSQGKFVWDRSENGTYYLEWYEDRKRRRARAGTRPAEVLEARRRKILELKGRATEQGRIVAPTLPEEEPPVPLTATIEAHLNHVKVNQKLNTYRRYRSVLAHFRDYFSSKKYLNEISRGKHSRIPGFSGDPGCFPGDAEHRDHHDPRFSLLVRRV